MTGDTLGNASLLVVGSEKRLMGRIGTLTRAQITHVRMRQNNVLKQSDNGLGAEA